MAANEQQDLFLCNNVCAEKVKKEEKAHLRWGGMLNLKKRAGAEQEQTTSGNQWYWLLSVTYICFLCCFFLNKVVIGSENF